MVLGKKNVTLSVLIVAVFLMVMLAACSTTPKEQPAEAPAMDTPSKVSTYTPPPKAAPKQMPAAKSSQPQMAVELGDVFFAFDRSDLSSDSRATLADNADVLRSNPDVTVSIQGHCDERGTVEYNLGLGERRASSVRNYLMSLGISGSRIQTISYGEERPFQWGHNEGAWSQNRRAHFVVK